MKIEELADDIWDRVRNPKTKGARFCDLSEIDYGAECIREGLRIALYAADLVQTEDGISFDELDTMITAILEGRAEIPEGEKV